MHKAYGLDVLSGDNKKFSGLLLVKVKKDKIKKCKHIQCMLFMIPKLI